MDYYIHHTIELGDRAFWILLIILALAAIYMAYTVYPTVMPFLFPSPQKGPMGFSKQNAKGSEHPRRSSLGPNHPWFRGVVLCVL